MADVLLAMEALGLPFEESPPTSDVEIRWFSSDGAVAVRGTIAHVFVAGSLIGAFDEDDDDRGPRNILAVTLAKTDQFHLGRLAEAFGIGQEYLRRLRRKEQKSGLGAVLGARQGKNSSKVTEARRAEWFAMFDAGQMPVDAHRSQPRKDRRAYSTVWQVYQQWKQARARVPAVEEAAAPVTLPAGQLTLWSAQRDDADADEAGADETDEPIAPPAADEDDTEIVPMTAQPVRGGKLVQHVGSWILLSLAGELGLYEEAQTAFKGRHPDGLRIALDAVICALAIRQFVVEGVRRLATPSGATLLRAERVPSASGVRKLLARLLEQTDGGSALESAMAERFVRAARSDDGPAVFYVDNHLRPYSGKHVLRKGWRMQDRRVLPGTSDYYVHDEDGRPVLRVAVPSHDSLSIWLPRVAQRMRDALGDEERIVLAFDRAGAHAELLAGLRDTRFEFVTYERKPFPELAASAFTPTKIAGEDVGLHESRLRNLGAGRGRIRRIAVRVADGRQVNFLAHSTLPAERLVEILWHRWRQENGFKHGVERWGINHLDGRSVEHYPPGTIIPNPARRRLERALRIARADEGNALRELARVPRGDARRPLLEQELAEAREQQQRLEALRPWVPKQAPVEETELANKLVRHDGKLKSIIDVIRVVCANAEADLAAELAPHMRRPREAKKLLANIFAAPGKVAVTEHGIHVRLSPAASKSELVAIQHLFDALNQRGLTLPSDHKRLPLHFDLARSHR